MHCLYTSVALFRCGYAMADASLMGSRAPEEESHSNMLVPADDASAPPPNEVAVLGAVLSQLQAEFCCAICQGLVVAPHMLPCSHRFCGACIFKWTPRHNTCPTCRAVIRGPLALERGVVRSLRRSVTQSYIALTRTQTAGRADRCCGVATDARGVRGPRHP